jgi:DNA repair exonuclease SbcCD ATPase subunit
LKRRPSTTDLLIGLAAIMPMAATVHAQTQRSGGGEAQKIMQQYQQLAVEKTALQAQVAQMKRDLESAQTELAAAKKERDALKARTSTSAAAAAQLARANESKESAEKSLEQNKQRTEELVERFKQTIGTLKGVESDRAQLQRNIVGLNAALDKCAADNVELYDISSTVLDRYDHVGLFTKVGTAEPFTRITRTRIDNLVIEYRARAEALRVKSPATP